MSTVLAASRTPLARGLRGIGRAIVVAAAVASCATSVIIVERGGEFALAQGTAAIVLELGAAIALVVAGLGALARRRPFALVVVALGGAWAAREWANPAALGDALFTLGLLLGTVWIPLAGWVALAYPRGVPLRLRDRLVIGFGVVATLAPGVVRAMTFDPARNGCVECPADLVLIGDARSIASGAASAGVIIALLLCVVTLACLAGRFADASPAQRLLISPVAASSAAALALESVGLAVAWLVDTPGLGVSRTVNAAVAVSLMAVAVAVSWEIVRLAAARGRSARLISELSAAPRPGRLREKLAEITHDPSLELLFPLGDRVVDTEGRQVADPRAAGEDRMRRTTPAVGQDGAEIALLTHRPGLLDDGEFRDTVARAAGLALEHERLQAELASRVSDLRESRRQLVASFDAERRRLERDLHDGAQQQVVALLLELRLASARHPDPALGAAIGEVGAALDELRSLAHGLYPAALAEDGLVAALDELRETAEIPVRLVGGENQRWPSSVETTAYVVVAETLHGHGLCAADVDLAEVDGILRVTVSGGRDSSADWTPFGHDLAGLEDRVGAVGGELRIDATARALTVRAELPCVS